jgi:hypothetical protein
MRHSPVEAARDDLLRTLRQVRREAGEPEIGGHYTQLIGTDPVRHRALAELRAAGLVAGRGFWIWITERGMQEEG